MFCLSNLPLTISHNVKMIIFMFFKGNFKVVFLYVSCLNWKLLHAWSMLVLKLLYQYVGGGRVPCPITQVIFTTKAKCHIFMNTHFYDGVWCFPMYAHFIAEAMIRLKETCIDQKNRSYHPKMPVAWLFLVSMSF